MVGSGNGTPETTKASRKYRMKEKKKRFLVQMVEEAASESCEVEVENVGLRKASL